MRKGNLVLWSLRSFKWAASRQNQQNCMCALRRLRSAWASALSDQSSLSAWRKLESLAAHRAHREDSDQPARLIGVFAGRTVIMLVLSWGGSYVVRVNSEGSGLAYDTVPSRFEIANFNTINLFFHYFFFVIFIGSYYWQTELPSVVLDSIQYLYRASKNT